MNVFYLSFLVEKHLDLFDLTREGLITPFGRTMSPFSFLDFDWIIYYP
jgi:hypothetical protein